MGIVYILKLKRGKFYVGYTTDMAGFKARMYRHNRGYGSSWTNKYPVIKIHRVIHNASKETEKQVTLEYMRKYGYQNVRGYIWSSSYTIDKPKDI